MKASMVLTLAQRLMGCPAVAFHEMLVCTEVEAICREHQLECRRDRFGNVLIEHRCGRTSRPLVLMAHMDHPGFEIIGRVDKQIWKARFLGGVPASYFRRGIKVRILPGGNAGRLLRMTESVKARECLIQCGATLKAQPEFAVWELPDFALRKDQIHGRACDDLIGVATILATLIELEQTRSRAWVMAAITRAEEVGFGGALALAGSRQIPANALVVSLETSREISPAKMAGGVIIRVGDRSSIFDNRASRFLSELAADLGRRKGFQFQRALMTGGTCEGTVLCEAGFQTAALCVALGNYHNCSPRNRIAAEFVSLRDVEDMVALLKSAAMRMPEFELLVGRLPNRLAMLKRRHRVRLLGSI